MGTAQRRGAAPCHQALPERDARAGGDVDQTGGEVGLPPFIVFTLPRSRTFWLSRFLSGDGTTKPCGHDVGAMVDTLADAKTVITEALVGTVETGSMLAWRW